MKRALCMLPIAALALVGTVPAGSAFADEPTPPSNGGHGMGLDLKAVQQIKQVKKPATFGTMGTKAIKAAPAEADLSQFSLPAGDQARTNSCVAWATGYSGYGVLMNQQKIPGAPMAPMFTYAQIVRGNDIGTHAAKALALQVEQGIDTKDHYGPGDYDVATQPNEEERRNAANYKLSGYQQLPTEGEAAKEAIKEAIAAGSPVPIGMQIRQNFNDINANNAMDYSYRPAGAPVGGHETTIVGYNSQGVKVLNSWGQDWGHNGFYTLPWDFVNWGDLMEAHAMGKVQGGNPLPTPPSPTTDPTDGPTQEPTDGPTQEPTVAPTENPTDGPTQEPTVTPTENPTDGPTQEPTVTPTQDPTEDPSVDPDPATDDDWDFEKEWKKWMDWVNSWFN